MFCSLSVSCGAPRGQWKCQGHYIGSVHSERLKVSSCTQQDVQSDRSLFLQLAFEGKAEHQDVHLKDTHSKQTNAVQHTLTSSLASLRESSTSEKLKLATVMNWLTTDTNLSPYSWGRFFWNSSSCMRDRNCVHDLLLSLKKRGIMQHLRSLRSSSHCEDYWSPSPVQSCWKDTIIDIPVMLCVIKNAFSTGDWGKLWHFFHF